MSVFKSIIDGVQRLGLGVGDENSVGTAETLRHAFVLLAVYEVLSLIHISEPTRPY